MVSLQEKIKERIQGLTAELISDEELKQAIRESVEKLFFEPQKFKDGYHTICKVDFNKLDFFLTGVKQVLHSVKYSIPVVSFETISEHINEIEKELQKQKEWEGK